MNSLSRDLIPLLCQFLDKSGVDNLSLTSSHFYKHTLPYKHEHFVFVVRDVKQVSVPEPILWRRLRWDVDSPVENLDFSLLLPRLLQLTFGDCFNQPVEKLRLPDCLTHLKFGQTFDCSVEKLYFPHGLTHLFFGDSFAESLVSLRHPPIGLTHLRLGQFSHRVDHDFEFLTQFPNLIHLSINFFIIASIINWKQLAPNLETLIYHEVGPDWVLRTTTLTSPDQWESFGQ